MPNITESKIAIVTGSSRGIGRGIALALGQAGWSVVINYNTAIEAAEETKTLVEQAGGRGLVVRADVARREDRQRLVDEALRAFGRIDLLVNNAGVAPDVRADVLEATEESFDRLIAINVKGPYFLTQLVANRMIAQGTPGAKIINITSLSAFTAHTNRGDYSISKAALSMVTQVYAARLAEHGIHVYEIRPGIIATDMTAGVKQKYDSLIFEKDLTPIKRWGTPDDVARAVIAIANDALPFSTGEVINVDGGFHMRRL